MAETLKSLKEAIRVWRVKMKSLEEAEREMAARSLESLERVAETRFLNCEEKKTRVLWKQSIKRGAQDIPVNNNLAGIWKDILAVDKDLRKAGKAPR
ncbi:hypothetical protein L1987_61532 [Smallanthus sonchifolius]|uniref:Uncharacterized protein n=1 Tax=Smallanthus sonchifolius TaxID=185202 RepID=A0ACB9C859_9ASTR|nr:hypothetical protein L1987_61532 [Smallanthus sonchifolius]